MRGLTVFALAGIAAGCPGKGAEEPRGATTAGLSLTYYRAEGELGPGRLVVVEQRRWVEIGGDRTLDIDRIDDGADLESLVIEPLGGSLTLGRCARDSVVQALKASSAAWVGRGVEITVADGRTVTGTITSLGDRRIVVAGADGRSTVVAMSGWRAFRLTGGDSVVRCEVEGGRGRQLVRVVYTTRALGFESEHTIRAVVDDADRGTVEIVPRFTVETPPWQVVADVTLYDGMPGGNRAPNEVFRGPITLAGEPVVVSGPTRSAPARIEAVYRYIHSGYSGETPRDPSWHNGVSYGDVFDWLELELGDATLPPGRVLLEVTRASAPPQLVMVTEDALELPDPESDQTRHTRIRLWPTPDLRGGRNKMYVSQVQNDLIETVLLSISNGGDRPREVLVEEELRPTRRKVTVLRPFPRKPTLRSGLLRVRLTVPPGKVAHAGFVLDYEL